MSELDQARADGWEVAEQHGDQTVLTKPSWGSWKVHAILLIPTVGMGNVAYGAYRRFISPPQRVVGQEEASSSDDEGVPYRSLADLDGDTRTEIDRLLADDEEFILGIRSTDGIRKSRKTRWFLTDRRVIAMKQGTLSEESRDIPLSSISSVEYDQGVTTTVSLSGSGVDEEFYTMPAQGKAFTAALRQRLLD